MKTRNGFVSNSSSSSFITGHSKEEKILYYKDVYNLEKLKELKKLCIESKIQYPKEILDIERKANCKLEDIKDNTIYSKEKVSIKIPTITHCEDKIVIKVSDIPVGVETITFKYVSE